MKVRIYNAQIDIYDLRHVHITWTCIQITGSWPLLTCLEEHTGIANHGVGVWRVDPEWGPVPDTMFPSSTSAKGTGTMHHVMSGVMCEAAEAYG